MNRVLAYERVRATTLKSTYFFPLIGAAIAWAASILFIAMGADVDEVALSDFIGQAFTPLSAVFLTIPFAQAFGQEYRDGTIRLALSEFPKRTSLFAAKLIIPAAIAFIATVITIAGIALIAALGPSFGYVQITGFDAALAVALREAVFVVLWGLLVAAITALTRNMAAGIAGVLVWGLIAENLLALFLIDRFPAVVELFPIGQGFAWVQIGQTDLILPMVGTALILTAASYWKFVRTDA
jgi:ABC-type transport system involved in multi-copper enzyme maturation permease subunit